MSSERDPRNQIAIGRTLVQWLMFSTVLPLGSMMANSERAQRKMRSAMSGFEKKLFAVEDISKVLLWLMVAGEIGSKEPANAGAPFIGALVIGFAQLAHISSKYN